jgi:hypothetical protein
MPDQPDRRQNKPETLRLRVSIDDPDGFHLTIYREA